MKATSIIIAAVLSLQFSLLFAGNDETRSIANNEAVSNSLTTLAPVTPVEASFEDAELTNTFNYSISVLAPVTPVEADFSDVVPEKNIDLTILAPVTPAQADFSDNTENLAADFSALAPLTPAEADFE
jgi:hypothetical protein